MDNQISVQDAGRGNNVSVEGIAKAKVRCERDRNCKRALSYLIQDEFPALKKVIENRICG